MKVFAVQKNTNTYAPQFKKNTVVKNTGTVKDVGIAMPTYMSEDKFVSKVSFGASINQLEAKLAKLDRKLELGKLTEDAYEKLARPLREEIYDLRCQAGLIDTGGNSGSAQYWIDRGGYD